MKLFNILFVLVFTLMLVGSVSALNAHGEWEDGSQYYTLNDGESVNFEVDVVAFDNSVVSVKMYDSSYNLVHTFEQYNSFGQIYNVNSNVYDGAGVYNIIISGDDGFGADNHVLHLTVEEVIEEPNNAPIITSTPVTSIDERENYYYDVNANDVDGDVLTYSLVNSPSWLSINSNTGVITGLAPSVSSDTDYSIRVRVSDGQLSVYQNYTLRVLNMDISTENYPPVITSNPSTSIDERENYYYDVNANDVDGDVLTYSLVNSPSWLSINSNTGVITGTAPSVSSDTDYSIRVRVSDGQLSVYQDYTLRVLNMDISTENHPPVINSLAPSYVYEGNVYTYSVEASDLNGDRLLYSLYLAPGWLSINPTTGVITGLAPSVSSDTSYRVELRVDDRHGGVTNQIYYLTVRDSEGDTTAPVITIVSPRDRTYDDSRIYFRIQTNEIATAWFVLDGNEYGMNTEDSLEFNRNLNLNDGRYTVTFYARDVAGNVASTSIDFRVDEDNGNGGSGGNGGYVNYNQYNEDLYLDQFKPKLATIDLSEEEDEETLNFWQRLWRAIVNFFKWLF